MSWGVLPWVYPIRDSLGFSALGGYFLNHLREVFDYYLLKYFLMPFLFVFFWDTYCSNVGVFNIVQGTLRLSSFLLILFSFFLSASLISTILSTTALILFCLSYSTVDSIQSSFNLSYCIVHY